MHSTKYQTVHEFVKQQENAYQKPIPINNAWDWSMHKHIKLSVLYKNSQFEMGNSEGERMFKPFKNIVRPILNLQYRAEGFDVKDIQIFVDDNEQYYKSLLVKKFHEKWAIENNLDTFIDQLVESYIDFGGVLVKNVDDVKPEVVPLQSIAFCDQTDLLSGPIGIKHFYSPDQLLEMADKGWGDAKHGATASLQETIRLSREEKDGQNQDQTHADTPGKYIEVYEVHGNMPKHFLNKGDDTGKYVNQLQIICFYTAPGGMKGEITLFRAEEPKSPFKFLARDAVYGRALGFGGVEELLEPQVWTNYSEVARLNMLDAASKTILKAKGATSSTIANKNKIKNLDNLSIIDVGPDGELDQVDTFPRNEKLFTENNMHWLDHARWIGSAQEAISGDEPNSGTPFKSVEFQAQESHSLHNYRRGKLATFIGEIYRDWVIPYIAREVSKGQKFLAELDLKELQYVNDAMLTCYLNNYKKERILSGELVEQEEVDGYEELVKQQLQKQGSKRFTEILKGELKSAPLSVKVNVAGKQYYLAQAVDKISNIVRFVVAANPMVLADQGIWDLINQTVEKSGLDPVDFTGIAASFKKMQQQMQQQQQMATQETPSPLPVSQPQNAIA